MFEGGGAADGFSAYNVERLRAADTLVMGRTTFEAFKAYWPPVKDDPTQPLVEREISRLNTAAEKVVVSDTMPLEQTGAWGPTRVVRRADAHAEIAKLKQLPGKDLLMFGSHYVWNDLLNAGLVDELHIMLGPSLLARERCYIRSTEADARPENGVESPGGVHPQAFPEPWMTLSSHTALDARPLP